jgi:hypothetical protein
VKELLDNQFVLGCFMVAFEVGMAGDVPRLPEGAAGRNSLVLCDRRGGELAAEVPSAFARYEVRGRG